MKTNEALNFIDETFLEKVYSFAYRRCNTSFEAEELCSKIILTVVAALQKSEKIENFYGFVWTVARRVYADYCEERNRNSGLLSLENIEYSLSSRENEIDLFLEDAATAEQLKKILYEITFLSKAYRDVMVMYYIDEIKVKDIAVMLGISETTVKQRLFSARNEIRKEVSVMKDKNLSLKPVSLAFIGTGNPLGNDPRTKAERILSQNIVYACKDKAKSAKELSEELCVPMPYIEDELAIQLKGENGKYGLLRKAGDRYIANIIIVDSNEFNSVNEIYTKHLNELCKKLKTHLNNKREEYLNFPYLSRQTDLSFVFWSQINESVWFIKDCVDKILEEKYFTGVKLPERKFTTVAIAVNYDTIYDGRFYGCDGTDTKDFCGYSNVFVRNIYGKRMDKHFHACENITTDEKFNLTLKSIGGISVDTLSEKQKEIAAKAIECGFLRKCENTLEPRIVTIEQKDWENFRNLLNEYYSSVEHICRQIADELYEYMVSHIQKHLLSEYKSYNTLIAGINVLSDLIEKCIEEKILTAPKSRIGPEGVLLVVEK